MCYHVRAMAKVAPEVKTRLLAEGTWNDFTLFRKNAQRDGNSPAAAMRLAVAKFCPDLANLPPCPHRKGAKSAKELAEHPSTAITRAAGGLMAEIGVSLDVFSGKSCSMAKAVDWVIDSLALDRSQVRPEDAPAAKAWSLYQMCLKSPSFAEDIIAKAVVRQLPNGGEEEGGGNEAFSGESDYDLLAAMGEASP